MQKDVRFQLEEAVEIPDWSKDYPEHKFTVFKCCLLSTKPNSHELEISADVLKKCAETILGSFLVAKLEYGDATTHKDSEIIYGYFPKEQKIEFVEVDDILKAYAYAVVSKRYSKEFNGIFEFDNIRNSSVEMTVTTAEDNDNKVLSFDLYGLTVLGKTVNGSCPDADIRMVRFSTDDATAYFVNNEREQLMAEKAYKVDKSKEAMSEKAWGDIDKVELRNKIIEADNRAELVKDVYMLVEDGWEDAPSEHLKYPVMCFEGDTLVYNRYGLASALAYARQENETEVINKIERIYKKLDIDDSEGKEESVEMNEIELAESEVKEIEQGLAEGENIEKPAEECLAEDEEKAEEEVAETEPEEETEGEESEKEMSADEMMAKITELEKAIEERDNIIMEKETELEGLRAFKADIDEKEKAKTVEGVMAEVKDFLDDESAKSFREEGMLCKLSDIDGWANKVKAASFEATKSKKSKKENLGIWGFAAPKSTPKQHNNSVWDRI